MLEPLRTDFNSRFMPEKYQALLAQLQQETRSDVAFRVCETPCFFPRSLIEEMAAIGAELTHQLVDNPSYMEASYASIPEQYRVANESAHPHFMTVDFGLVLDEAGVLRPKLVELQAFPSIFGYQSILSSAYIQKYELDPQLRWLLGGLSEESYWALLRGVILGGHAPENVILVEVEPLLQKTLPDFHVYQDKLGIAIVDITDLRKVGKKLFYPRKGPLSAWVPVHRIYNRAIVDEIERKKIRINFDYRDELDVEWAGHPNWYFRVSKFSLPFLKHHAVPRTVFLDDWFNGKGADILPQNREKILLKPLYSFAGRGIVFSPTDEDLESIPASERNLYLLQERIDFEPVIYTPWGKTQAEIRILYLWPDGGQLTPTVNLVRMGRGLMMGVDQNRDQQWVGGSAGFFY